MNKKEIAEIKKLINKDRGVIMRLAGCYVDGDKNKVVEWQAPFGSIADDEIYKYIDIFKKSMSGSLGKNLLNMDFPTESEKPGGTQAALLALKESELKVPEMLSAFYDRVIETWYHPENFLILLIYGIYDVPGSGSDGLAIHDGSEYVYSFISCCLCPVTLSKASLCYNPDVNSFTDCIRDWIVDMPEQGFLFPAFNDRNTDIHSLLYYTKDAKDFCADITDSLLGVIAPLPAVLQKETFREIIEETLDEECVYDVVRSIHENLTDMIAEHEEDPEPLMLDKQDMRGLLLRSGAPAENLDLFEQRYDEQIGENMTVMAKNLTQMGKFEVKTPKISIKVDGEFAHLVETKVVDGVPSLVIALTDDVEVNGVHIRNKFEE